MKTDTTSRQAVEPESELSFFQKTIDSLPAIVYINELERPGDPASLKNLFLNQLARSFLNLSQEEISGMGSRFFEGVIHPDDLEIVPTTIKACFGVGEEPILVFMYRLKKADSKCYRWYYCHGRVTETFEDGSPKQLLTIGLEVTDTMHTQNQLTTALKEICQLKYALKLSTLTAREKEVLHLITQGKTDKEISKGLFISIPTAKKHRSNLIQKTGVCNTAELVALAVEAGEY
jgi:DNA-binding CsgD family transcriptional regulator